MSDTIAAIATAPGPSAIGVVRLSGPDTCTVLDRVFRPKNGRPMSRQEPRRLVLGDVLDRDGQVIDSALAVLFPGPGSYTGQDCSATEARWCWTRPWPPCLPPEPARPRAASSPAGPFSTAAWTFCRRRPWRT